MRNVAIISARSAEHVDFDAVSRAARGSIEHIVRHLLPDARRQGHELVAVNPTRADNRPGSFKINAATGVWSDFATNEKGGDMIDLWAYIRPSPSSTPRASSAISSACSAGGFVPRRCRRARARP